MPNLLDDVDTVFWALADATRRQVVEQLATGPQSTSVLAGAYDMSLPAFTQHLGVLENAGLVSSEKSGRVRTYRLVPETLARAGHWLDQQRQIWNQRLDQLDELVINLDREQR